MATAVVKVEQAEITTCKCQCINQIVATRLLNHDLHAIDATPARWCGVVVYYRSFQPARPRSHWLIYAQANAASR